MADYKDYIVRYDIQASVQNAAIGLKELEAIVTQLEAPMTNISKAISQVSSSMQQLKQNSQITFAPKIDIAGFNNQLRKMVVDVRAAATEMHAALFEALAGNPKATSAIKNGLSKTLASPQSLAQIKREIESYERELDKLYGTRKKSKRGETIRNRDGSIFYAKKANMHERVAQLEGQGKAIRARISQLKADQAVLEKMEKDAAATTARTAAATKKAAVKAQAAPVTNVTPAVIRQWKQAFGDAKLKNLTVNIRGNASGPKGALTVIEQVMASLKTLQNQASFTINPILHAEGFAAAEAQLRSLAKLSGKVVAAFGGQTGKDGKVKSAASIPVNVKISASSITESIKGMKRPTLPVAVKLMWDKGAVGRQEQLKGIQSKIPPIKLTLDSTQAIAKLEEFIALIKSSSPQNIALTASSSAGAGSKTGAVGTRKGKGTTGMMPLTPRQYRDQLGKHLGRGFTLPPNYATQITDQQRRRSWQLDRMRRDAISAFANPTPFEVRENAAKEKESAKSRAKIAKAAQTRHFVRDYNFMRQFAKNQTEANILAKHAPFFRQAAKGFSVSYPEMAAIEKMAYLNKVANLMSQSNVQVPWALESHMRTLDKQLHSPAPVPTSKSSGSYVPVPARQKPFFDRARKWAYPFTGQTSFGARTPMAVDMAKGMGVMFAIGGAMSAIGGSFGQAMEYQNTMRTTQAILQHGTDSYSQSEFRNMEGIVREVGVKTKFSAPEVASAARFLAMAGYDISGINAAIRPIADLALIGDSDLGETADKMTNILTTFGINADKLRTNPNIIRQYANIMATTATRSNTDLMMLAESAKYGGGVANLYGRNDPNLFADTMALFGVMGNAGIQASSAGTALRMMYQNIFKPNKNQKKVLDMMQSTYGISTINADGSYRAMSSILTEMAQRIPENRMAEIVGNLFRITAQPGAAASLLAAAGGDQNAANEIGAGIDILSDKMSNKRGMSALVSLMLANRNSINGNISGSIAEEKQNTIAGLWAQVTSTFTEGIVQAFEQRQGGFEGMLRELRDYLAKPETVTMLQKLLDMVIEIGKVLAWVVSLWAEIYSTAPDLIKFWVKWQLIFTQLGSFIAPVVALIGVFNRLGGVIAWLTGVSSAGITASAGRVAAGGAAATAANAAMYAPLVVGSGRKGRPVSIRGNFAARTRQQLANNAILAGELALSGADLASTRASLDSSTRNQAMAVRNRAQRIYGTGPRIVRAFRGGMSATLSVASLAPMFGGLGKLFTGLLAGIAKAIGLVCSPIGLATVAIGGLSYGIYKLAQYANGTTEAQIAAQKRMAEAGGKMQRAMYEQGKWYLDRLKELQNPSELTPSSRNEELLEDVKRRRKDFQSRYAIMQENLGKDYSQQKTDEFLKSYRAAIKGNPQNLLAFGEGEYEAMVGNGIISRSHSVTYDPTYDKDGSGFFSTWLYNTLVGKKDDAAQTQLNAIPGMLRTAGLDTPAIIKAYDDIVNLRKEFLSDDNNKSIKTEAEYQEAVGKIINGVADPNRPGLFPSSNIKTLEQFWNIKDYTQYKDAVIGQNNFLWKLANGYEGTEIGYLNAIHDLPNEIKSRTDQFWTKINNIIAMYPRTMALVAGDEGQKQNIEYQLALMPDGRINFNKIVEQIQQHVASFQAMLSDYADMAAAVYKLLSQLGIEDGSADGAKKYIRNAIKDQAISEQSLREYWQTYIEPNVNSEWRKWGYDEDKYVKFMLGKHADGRQGAIKVKGETVKTQSEEKNHILNNITNQSIKTAGLSSIVKSSESGKTSIEGNDGVKNGNGGGRDSTGVPHPVDQDIYASHYDKSAARPTQIVNHININFDRTAIAANADERDLIAAMEQKLGVVAAQFMAQLTNQITSNIS